MGKVKTGPLIHSITGKVGDVVFGLDKGQQVVKSYGGAPTMPADSTHAILFLRAVQAAAQDAWLDLDADERELWEAAAQRFHRQAIRRYVNKAYPEIATIPTYASEARSFFLGCYCNASVYSQFELTWDILEEDWDAQGTWNFVGGASVEINPAGQLHLVPGPSAVVYAWMNIGAIADVPFTVEDYVYFDALGAQGTSNHGQMQIDDGVYFWNVLIYTDKVGVYNSAGSYDYKAFTTATGTWYYWRFWCDNVNGELRIERSPDRYNWVTVGVWTDISATTLNDGDCYIVQGRGAAGTSESHHKWTYIGTGAPILPVVDIHAPVRDEIPPNVDDEDWSCAAGVLIDQFDFPGAWDDYKHRVAIWGLGGDQAGSRIYRQLMAVQPDPTINEVLTQYVRVTGGTVVALVDRAPDWVRVQSQVCDITTGLLSSGGIKDYVDIE